MSSSTMSSSDIVSIPRITTLLSSLLVALACGTNYVFSAYAPQLGARLQITHTRLNIIGLAGNMGVYSTGPLLGRVVDTRGPRYLLAGAFVCLLVGYSGIRYIFDNYTTSSGSLSPIKFWFLVLCTFMTGVGGGGGLSGSVNATAKSFPDRARATTTGIVLSGFGLSAFLFGCLSSALKTNTSSFLLLLALGTSLPMIIGFFLVRPIPLPIYESVSSVEHGVVSVAPADALAIFQHENASQTPLLFTAEEPPSPSDAPLSSTSLELSPTRSSVSETNHRRSRSHIHPPSFGNAVKMLETLPNIHGKQLWMSGDFWLIFVIMSLLSGTGIMYINNVGSISQALFAKGNPNYDEATASRWQAAQVSAISITNFLGRILIGIMSDFSKNRFHLPRSYCISLVAFLFIVSQIMGVATDDVTNLWKASLALGLAYGGLFGLFPTIAIELFGIAHFSENWGFLSLSPMLGGNLFSIAFGRNLDAHSIGTQIAPPTTLNSTSNIILSRTAGPSEPQCLEGRDCYVASLYMTIAASCLALTLGVWAGWRDQQKHAAGSSRANAQTVVMWEDDE